MADVEPGPDNNYQVGPTLTFSRARWNAVMASIAARLKARELLEATFETLIANGTQAALDLISQNVAPQLEDLIEQINALEEQLEDIIGGGTAPNALQLGGQNPSYYLALANATGTLPVEKVTGVSTLIDAAVASLVNGSPAALDTLKELSDALGGDANFAASVAAALGGKLAKASNLSDLSDKNTALTNMGGGAAGIPVFKAATVDALLLLLGGTAGIDIFKASTASAAQSALGVSTFIKSLLDDTSGDAAFTTMGATKSFGSAGYQKLPSGLIIQWKLHTGGEGGISSPWPITFPNACLHAQLTPVANSGSGFAWAAWVVSFDTFGLTGIRRYLTSGTIGDAGEPVYVFGIGY